MLLLSLTLLLTREGTLALLEFDENCESAAEAIRM